MCAQTIALHNRDKQIAQREKEEYECSGSRAALEFNFPTADLMLSPKIPRFQIGCILRASYLDNEGEMAVGNYDLGF